MRLHICRRSDDQSAIGPRGVESQSTLRANLMCVGMASEYGILVQSKLGESPGTVLIALSYASSVDWSPRPEVMKATVPGVEADDTYAVSEGMRSVTDCKSRPRGTRMRADPVPSAMKLEGWCSSMVDITSAVLPLDPPEAIFLAGAICPK